MGEPVNWRPRFLRRLRRKIGMIFQEFNLIPTLSVLKNVLLGRLAYQRFWQQPFFSFSRRDNELALLAIKKVGISGLERKAVRELSGGQKQRVGIARALVQEPLLLLGDEPVSNLDPVTAERVLAHLVALCKEEKLALLLSLHAVELAKKYCDRIIGLREGRIVFEGKSVDLDDQIVASIFHEQ